jgi:hypothetical protein
MRKVAYIVLLSALPCPVWAQGVPIFDQDAWLRLQAIIDQGEKDLALQQEKLNSAAELKRLKEEQLATLQEIIDATTDFSGDDTSAMVEDLEGEDGEATAADDIYGAADPNPAAAQMFGDTGTDPNAAATFGDAGNNIETLIIQVAKDTHGLPGVSKAGLSVVQWRCLLQALIWQESRFTIGAKSPVGAFGLTQIMPGTAQDLGIYPDYYDSPYLQVTGGARYLAQMLNMFDGNIIHGLAAYNAGPGNVQDYHGVPPFAETQHYVVVIPERYNAYLASVGGIDALGTIDPSEMGNATYSLSSFGAATYANGSIETVKQAAIRIKDIVERIDQTSDVNEAMALNSYARAELARIMDARIRLKAAQTKPLGAEQLALAVAQAEEKKFLNFTMEDLQ